MGFILNKEMNSRSQWSISTCQEMSLASDQCYNAEQARRVC